MIKSAFKVIAINLVLLLALVAAAELLYGTWFSKDPLDQLGLPRDTQTLIHAGPLYAGGGEFTYRRDHWGLRGQDDPAAITILTIGGSTTNQLYLSDEQTWQKVLERQLRVGGRGDAVVGNAGVDGQTSVGHLQSLRDWFPHIPGLKPRFVLAYVGVNDIQLGGAWVDTLRHATLEREIRQKSAMFRLWRQVCGMIVAQRARLRHQSVDYAAAQWTDQASAPFAISEAALAEYRQRLKLMADEIHAMGAVPVFITQPRGDFKKVGNKVLGVVTESGPNGVDQYNALATFNAATRAVCRDNGLLCLDLARELEFAPGDFYDYLHNTPQGAEKIGRWLSAKLAGLV